jgi:hypothetical protein
MDFTFSIGVHISPYLALAILGFLGQLIGTAISLRKP